MVGLHGLGSAFETLIHVEMYCGANTHRLFQKISRCPSLLFVVMLMSLGHMASDRSKVMLFITASMQGNTLVLIVDLYIVGIVDSTHLFTNELIRNAVMVIVFAQGDMVIFLYFGQHSVPYYKLFCW